MRTRMALLASILSTVSFGAALAAPNLAIQNPCEDFVPLYNALPANECFVTNMLHRASDDGIIGAGCGKNSIVLFAFNPAAREVRKLDIIEAPWWDEPRVALGPGGDIFLSARRVEDKPFVFERLRERAEPPDAAYRRRDVIPAPGEVNTAASGMPIRRYASDGAFLREYPLPATLERDGVGAMTVCADESILYGISSPGGHLFTIDLESGAGKDHGMVVPFPEHHHVRFISKVLMPASDGLVYLCGSLANPEGEADDEALGHILAFNPRTGSIETCPVQVPAVAGRRRFASIDAAVKLADGSFIAGSSDGYLFRFDPAQRSVEAFGKPLRQGNIPGLALGADGMVYGVGGESGGLPRLFAFDPTARTFTLGAPPSGTPSTEDSATFGDIGGLACTSDGTLVCAERERHGYLLLYPPEAQRFTWSKTWEKEDLGRCMRDRYTDFADGVLRLAPTYLISDAMARSMKVQEHLDDKTFARKTFDLPAPCREVEILFYGGGGTSQLPMLIRVNRYEVLHEQKPERMFTGGWARETIPGEYLHPGENEIIFGRAGYLLVDTDVPGTRSAKSQTWYGPWKQGVLGQTNDRTGEYVVRVRVHGYPSGSTATSPVFDLAEVATPKDSPNLPPALAVQRLELKADAVCPPGTEVALAMRSGGTPEYVPSEWSDWVSCRPAETPDVAGRFVQWRATFANSPGVDTPVLRGVMCRLAGEEAAANRGYVKVITPPNNEAAESSYPFSYADPSEPRMRYLRDKYGLDCVVAAGKTESERFALLRTWVRQQWEGWNENTYEYCPPWDALEVLDMAPKNLGLGMCTHYATVFVQCAAALGYPARHVIVDHHCLAEVWSDQYGKWILQDPGFLPKYPVAFQYEANGVPLNALELHRLIQAGRIGDLMVVPDPPIPIEEMRERIAPLFCRFAIPLRNDHLYRPEPQELEHGMGQYHWDGYLWWSDNLNPKHPEYSLTSNREADFYWTLHKTRIFLTDSDTAGQLSVQLSGAMPNFKGFRLRVNNGEWQDCERRWTWQLVPGKNTLEAYVTNTSGIMGPANRVEVEYTP